MPARIRTLVAIAGVVYLLFGSLAVQGTPIRPDANSLVEQPGNTTFIPARVGWDSTEGGLQPAVRNPMLDSLTPERINADFRETVLSTALPDLWLVITLTSAILLLRGLLHVSRNRLRQQRAEHFSDKAAA